MSGKIEITWDPLHHYSDVKSFVITIPNEFKKIDSSIKTLGAQQIYTYAIKKFMAQREEYSVYAKRTKIDIPREVLVKAFQIKDKI